MVKGGYVPGRTHPTDRARGQTTAMPTAVAAARQSYADHPMVRLETAPPGPCHAVSLQETPSDPCSTSATVILGRIVRLYAESNATSNLDVSIILAQTALETFAYVWFGEKRGPEGVWIDNALKKFLIPTHVPGRLPALKQLAQENHWAHGPHAIVELRNPMVHARQNTTHTPVAAEHEAKQLALWFVELGLLKLLGFRGEHACRLNQVHRAGATEPVPWSQGC